MTAVRARFYVSEIKRQAYDADSTFVTMQAVSRGEHNKEWSRYTPSGSVTMQIKSPLAAQIFADRLGQEFDLLFTPVEDGNVYRDQHSSAVEPATSG